ncbi:MAG TPA: 4Fe-4S dicluster domain-containing protein [Gemmataceae bacterium]|nr:4Fe-4S dicluster domain-containing protein [Gemmataceae bacterium]
MNPPNVWLPKPALQRLIDRLRGWGYGVFGPRVADGAVTIGEVATVADLPAGVRDEQQPGRYRLTTVEDGGYFDHVNGPHSLKPFLFPPRTTVLEVRRVGTSWEARAPEPPRPKQAVLGVRACDLHALAVQDRVFLGGPHPDPEYVARRDGLFLVAVNCGRSAATCFCSSMDTGPEVGDGADLVFTELADGFVVRIGTEAGARAVDGLGSRETTAAELAAAKEVPKRAAGQQTRRINPATVRDTLMNNLTHPRWDDVAARCLACTNCTMVCPTCFCSTVNEVTDLAGSTTTRERVWESCFNEEHSWTPGGPVHATTKTRYRQWLTHKLATWIDQFGTSGCVGCGRCITWCPVGIDVTEEEAAMEGGAA